MYSDPDNQIDWYIRLFGGSPELYAASAFDYAVALGSNAIVTNEGIGYVVSVIDHSVNLMEVGSATSMRASRDACRLQYESGNAAGTEMNAVPTAPTPLAAPAPLDEQLDCSMPGNTFEITKCQQRETTELDGNRTTSIRNYSRPWRAWKRTIHRPGVF